MITVKQAKELQHGDMLYHVKNKNVDGSPQRWKVNGQVKTWKRDLDRVKVPLKFGLYGYDYLENDSLDLVCLTEEEAQE